MWGFGEYVSVAEKRKRAQKELKKLLKKNPDINPVVIEGKKIAKNWWGLAWMKTLETYADYSNRIDRGRSYVKNGLVLHLEINEGVINAIVMGTNRPYKVSIIIEPLEHTLWVQLLERCNQRIESMSALAQGEFPKELEKQLLGSVLFPDLDELYFDCSCPDYADVCKHVSAVLYAMAAQFDKEPTLFFELRGVDFKDLLKKSIEEKMKDILKNADKKSKRVIQNADIGQLFGIADV